jgi:hypothetical protein
MALAIDALVQKADSTTTTLATMIPEIWAAELEPNLRKRAVLQQSVLENTDLLGQPGDIVHIVDLPDIAAAAAVAEGTPITVNALNASAEVQMTPSEVATAIGVTRKALDRIKYDGMAAIVDRLAYAMSLYIEGGIAALYNGTVPTKGGSLTNRYPNGHASGTVVAGDTFSVSFLQDSLAVLQSLDVVPYGDDLFQLYVHPFQARDLMKDSAFRDDMHFAEPQLALRGEIGIYRNCHVIVTNHIVGVTENTVAVRKALLTSPRWAAIAWKRRPEIVVDPTMYDFGRRRQLAVTADMHIALLHNERALTLTTAAA